jgi:hypothetical protein
MNSINKIESPCPPERNFSDHWAHWASHEINDSWGVKERPSEREKSDGLDLQNTTRTWPSMGSTSPPGEMPIVGVLKATNGVKASEHESRFPRLPAKSPPTGPRLGAKPRRPSPDRKGTNYRRDWSSPDNSGGPYRDREAVEKNWRKHPESGPRHAFKHVDTYKPSYPSGRAHACDDSSQSPPLRQGVSNLDKGHIPANRNWDPTRDQATQERSRSPLQRGLEAAREVADRLNNLPKAKEGSNQGQKRAQPSERNQEDLATAACTRDSDARATLSPSSLLSRGLPSISQHPPGHDAVQSNNSTIAAPNESVQRLVR